MKLKLVLWDQLNWWTAFKFRALEDRRGKSMHYKSVAWRPWFSVWKFKRMIPCSKWPLNNLIYVQICSSTVTLMQLFARSTWNSMPIDFIITYTACVYIGDNCVDKTNTDWSALAIVGVQCLVILAIVFTRSLLISISQRVFDFAVFSDTNRDIHTCNTYQPLFNKNKLINFETLAVLL